MSRVDMFAEPDADPRTEPPPRGDERTLLTGFLRWQRETLELKCTGLEPAALARRAVEPSTMSLLGLIRHLAEVERGWFRRGLAGLDAPRLFCSADFPDGDFDGAVADPAVVTQARQAWWDEVAFADQFVADAPDLDLSSRKVHPDRGVFTLRWVLLHMLAP